MKTGENGGWQAEYCTKSKCRTFLDPGAGIQFLDENGAEQRYCWEHWQKFNVDPKNFPEVKQ